MFEKGFYSQFYLTILYVQPFQVSRKKIPEPEFWTCIYWLEALAREIYGKDPSDGTWDKIHGLSQA